MGITVVCISVGFPQLKILVAFNLIFLQGQIIQIGVGHIFCAGVNLGMTLVGLGRGFGLNG